MCDNDSIKDMIDYNLRTGGLSRRKFGALTLGVSVVSALPAIAGAAETKESEVEIKTPDGTADAYFVHPAAGKHPGVLIWPDIFGLRPTFRQMGKRLAESGYAVLVVNPFYRTKKAPTAPDHPDFSDPPTRQMLMSLHDSLSPTTAKTDAKEDAKKDPNAKKEDLQLAAALNHLKGLPLTTTATAALVK